ncbi:esterase/lipase family protein [Saccharothrix longispora]|uniref:esterase/lipase family protein n=1 Tax=Saccharothrix longispora TaxID=33920 RepID=UPI0028FDA932|nr:alpha/beta fold hydrolase [Saccharothrix longispora]MDU0288179.1 alpha/beta fold hydrolase [Saccharothrix longispora]
MVLIPTSPGPVDGAGLGVDLVSRAFGAVLGAVRALPDAVASGATGLWPPGALVKSEVGQRVIGFANGAFGDRVAPRGDTLPSAMSLRLDHRRVRLDRASLAAAYPSARGRLVVFLHGLVDTERSWFHADEPEKGCSGTDFGSRLAAAVPCTPLYLRYNSGRHVSDNGRELVDLLDELVGAWPVEVTDIVLVGHSMGGLVARSAAHQAHERGARCSSLVTRLVCLGTPHAGAPLERAVARTAAVLERLWPAAPLCWLLALRSDGIKDLAEGYLHEHQWAGEEAERREDPAPPAGVRQLFVSATLSRSEDSAFSRIIGDLLVDPVSAAHPELDADRRWLGGLNHFDLQRHDSVHETVLDWLRETG